ncbi:Coenzyme PQQ synthesis protein D (PqqD) [Micromonospora nigra]|uniref:Coenzyme PQQ synthesis protein D (PqqD) n=1 Tax=Micromonospora nigra TaxID=145857 RepID=A0A1C6T167_9ACTN|nr:PqqD family protein [Micromonospora nigra]SCL35437.1 Coenzyme PQQ synthesis protein D (PqqD) [Micromonospora nigra]
MVTQQETVHRVDPVRVAWRLAGEEVVVLDTARSVYFGLDRNATLLWQRLVGGATSTELVATLMEGARVDRDRASADVATFLDELLRHDLLQRP